MNAVRWVRRVALAAVLTQALVGLSRVPWTPGAAMHAELRLAWRFRSPLVDHCRRLTAAELAKLPAHMRQPVSCERRLMPYALTVALDGAGAAVDTIRPRGARADRPLSLYEELPLVPGSHALRVRFAPLTVESAVAATAPPTLTLDTVLAVLPRRVVLVTLDEQRSALVVR